MKRLLLGVGLATAVSLCAVAPASADPFAGPPICSSPGAPISGTHGNTVITGNRYLPAGSTLTVIGNLTLAPGACLDAFTLGTVKVTGNVAAQRDSTLALGCTPGSIGPGPPCNGQSTNDVVGGDVTGDHPLTMYLDGDTIGGNLTNEGGGPGGPTLNPYINFPIKDNVIRGNVLVDRWRGAWFGFIRNRAYGNVVITNNAGAAIGESGTPDSNEVASNTISGSLLCLSNFPAAQLGDTGGTANVVGGLKVGQCARL